MDEIERLQKILQVSQANCHHLLSLLEELQPLWTLYNEIPEELKALLVKFAEHIEETSV